MYEVSVKHKFNGCFFDSKMHEKFKKNIELQMDVLFVVFLCVKKQEIDDDE